MAKTEKYFADQFDDEEVLLVFRKHPVVMRKNIVLAAFGILLPVLYTGGLTFVYENNPEKFPSMNFFLGSLLVGFVLGIILLMPALIAWYFSVFIITDQRFIQITQKGLFHRSVVDIGLTQVQMVNYEIAGLQETMLGFGTIMVQTYMGDLVIHDVHHPAKIQKNMLHILRDQGVIITNHPVNRNEQEIEETETE